MLTIFNLRSSTVRTFVVRIFVIGNRAVVASLVLSMAALAQAAGSQWYINPMVGYQWFDGDRQLDDDSLLGIGIEYQYDDRWAVELKYLDSSLEGDDSNNDADLYQLLVEGMYLFGRREGFQPYLAAGLGHADFDYDVGDNEETQLTLGPGVRYWFTDRWSAKTDLRWVHSLDHSENDSLLTVAVSYAFGSAAAPKAASMAAVTAPGDRDGDGVIDDRDQCPNTPEGATVDDKGCPLDSDGDGVYDYKDECPNTPAGAAVDSKGCSEKLTRTESISLNVQFATNSAAIDSAQMDDITRVARFMTQFPTVRGTIEGHTDDTGAADYNKTLSQRRAEAVRQVLIDRYGINASRLSAVGFGEERPVADNSIAEGRRQNRRVVAVFEAEITE